MMTLRMTARDQLRAATDDVHLRLHRHAAFRRLADGTIDEQQYTSLLARLHGFHAPLEEAVARASMRLGLENECGSRQRVHLLHEDLLALRLTEVQIAALPRVGTLPALNTRGRLLGALYVRKGSTLGGRVLARGLDGLLGSGCANGRRFLAGDPGQQAEWQDLCSSIEAVAADGNLDDMITAAVETFSAFEFWIEEDGAR
ncbi:MAG: biliverdin-producing heme oxygenase [Nitrobacter sp.]